MTDAVAPTTRVALSADGRDTPVNVLIVGVGGQGVILVSKVLAWLAQQRGYQVKQSEVHGMAKRGGSVFSHVRYGREVWSPTIARGEVDLLIALEWAEALRWLPWLKPGSGMLVCDTRRIVPPFSCLNRRPGAALRYSRETPAEVQEHVAEGHAIDATAIAEALGNERASNVVLLGAVSTALEFTDEEWEAGLAEFVPPKTLVVNVEALRRGREWIDRARSGEATAGAPVAAASSETGHRGAARDHARVVQELRHLRQALSGALPAPRRRPHRRTRRSRQVHRLPAVRVAVPRLRDPGSPRTAPALGPGKGTGGSRTKPLAPRGSARMNAPDPGVARGPVAPPRLLSGNHAAALGALAAGCRFFAGYPITPSSEVAERMARLLPPVGGVFVQMEDEIASMAAVIGASMGGVKAMTATSGPGFSLKLENLGYAAAAEIPCVIVDVMRGGPSTGMPTRPAQGDLMQSRWGSHGDYPVIVVTPASVREVHDETVRAFALSESLRTPVVVLYDQAIAQLTETVELPAADTIRRRRAALGRGRARRLPAVRGGRRPGAADGASGRRLPHAHHRAHARRDRVPDAGPGHRRAQPGAPAHEAAEEPGAHRVVRGRAHRRMPRCWSWRSASARAPRSAPWRPRAHRALPRACSARSPCGRSRKTPCGRRPPRARVVLVPELNAGQLVLEVERVLRGHRVVGLNRYDGEPIAPAQIEARIGQLAREAHDAQAPRGA